jgi:CRISPR/Cas system-associated protein Csx1
MTLWERWKDKLEKLMNSQFSRSSLSKGTAERELSPGQKKAFEEELNPITEYVSHHYSSNNPRNTSRDERNLLALASQAKQTMFYLQAQIDEKERKIKSLMDFRRQEDWADSVEKTRLFLFRMLTAIGLASIILTTYYLGDRWGIPMPLRLPL